MYIDVTACGFFIDLIEVLVFHTGFHSRLIYFDT